MPKQKHFVHNLWQGLNVLKMHIDPTGKGWICHECAQALRMVRMPKFTLNNNLWLGEPPLLLRKLTFAENLLIARHYTHCYIFKLYPKDRSVGHNHVHLQRAMAGMLDINIVVVCLLHYINVKRTTVEFVVP